MVPLPGTILLGKYRVESVVGRGGMGEVLRVTHVQLGEELALKLLLPDAASNPELTARFLREAQSVVRLRGEHVARVSDIGLLPDGVPYIAMEYLHGVDLATELDRRSLAPGEVVDYLLQACEALAEAHANDIVHRDIKPSNLFLTTRPDGTPLIKVLDFGISKAPVGATPLVTRTDTVMGTPGYMSPEQMKAIRDVDGRTDIWALGIVLYECLNRRRPFEADSFSAVVLKAGTEPPAPMDPRIPRALQSVVLKCLEKDRAARFPSIAALASALAPFARDQRAAATVVDRTRLMLKRGRPQVEPIAQASRSSRPTTLSGSASMTRASSQRRRRMLGGTLLGIGVLALPFVLGWVISSPSPGAGDPPGAGLRGGTNSNGGVDDAAMLVVEPAAIQTPDATAVALIEPADATTPISDTPGVAVDAVTPASRPGEHNIQNARCVGLNAQQDWQGLIDCAKALAAADSDKAKEYADTEVREQRNELVAKEVQALVDQRNLRDARTALNKIGSDSVYFISTLEMVTKAEDVEREKEVRKAQGFASSHDCASLRNQYRQLTTTTTQRVAAAVAAVKCTDKAVASGNAAVSDPCAGLNVDELAEQATHQYSSGYSKVALALLQKVLACKQTAQLYRFAATYACAARDLAAAKLYLSRVPAAFQSAVVQRCQIEGLDVRPR